MRLFCHQPHFLPWPPYFNRLAYADTFLILDDVSFRKNYYQNRTKIIDRHGKIKWATVPVCQYKAKSAIKEIKVSRSARELHTCIGKLRDAYGNLMDSRLLNTVCEIIGDAPEPLLDLNLACIKEVMSFLGLPIPSFIRSSDLRTSASATNLLDIICQLGGRTIIVGMGKMAEVNNMQKWQEAGIRLEYQDSSLLRSKYLTPERQGVSLLHDVAHFGAEFSRQTVLGLWKPS